MSPSSEEINAMTASPAERRFRSRAVVATTTPERFAKQLVSHLSRKIAFATEGGTSSLTIGDTVGQVVIGDGTLTLLADGDTQDGVAVVEHVLGSHLERFAQREPLTVTWQRTTSSGPVTP
jgi:uncharacterized protein